MRSLFTALVLPNKFCMKTCQPSPEFLLAGWEGDECLMQTTPPAWFRQQPLLSPFDPSTAPQHFWGALPHTTPSPICKSGPIIINDFLLHWLGGRKGKIILCQAPGESDLAKSNITILLLMFAPNSKNLINSHQPPTCQPWGTGHGSTPRDLGKCHWKKVPRLGNLSETSEPWN